MKNIFLFFIKNMENNKCRDVSLIHLKNNVTNKRCFCQTSLQAFSKRCFSETSLQAFTLVELIVVITILAIL